jgi:cobalt-zinc-cadmium resistance protein CzcA
VGLIKNITDIENIIITKKNNVPIFVNDVASVKIGAAPRLGQVGIDENDDVVQGIILMRNGGSTLKTLKGIKERIDYIRNNRILPPGIEIVPYYDRSELVSLTTHTVLENFFVGMSLVIIILFVFLGNVRASAIAAVNIPFALLISFCGLVITGTPANLLSLGAVDFGIVVESTIIIVENKILHIHNNIGLKIKAQIQSAIHDVGRPMVFSTLILAVAFIPLFTMQGTEGAIFSPMAYTYAFAIGGALILSLTLTPVLGYFFMRKTALKAKKQRSNNGPVFEENTWVMKQIHRAYRPLLDMTLKHPKVTVAIWAIFVAGGLCCYSALGGEFMPKLEEGNLWIRGTMPISASLEQSVSVANRMRTILKQHPEIASVSSQVGRPDDGTDVAGFCNIELFAPLKPQKEWKRGVTKESLTNVLSKDLSEKFPNITLSFSQMISDNVEEALSGVKGENSIKIFGSDLYKNENIANEIISVLKTVRGITDLGVFGSLGQPSVRIEPDRIACAQYNLNPGDVVALVQTAIGGETVSEVFEGDQRFDLVVRWNKDYRSDIASITRLEVPTHNDGYVPIGQVAQIIQEDSPAVIFRENGHRYSPIKFSVRGRDLQSTVLEAQKIVSKEVRLPWDVHLSWSGEIDSLKNAISRLAIIVPITLLLIAFLAHAAVKDWLLGVVVFAGIPVACTGGLFALWIAGLNFSISAAMGFISIFGITVQYALIVVSYFQHQINSGHTLEQSVRAAGIARLRMALMTTLVATLGLLPAAVSTKIGVQTQKPLAAVIIGGTLAIAVVLTALLPAMILQAHKWARHERD